MIVPVTGENLREAAEVYAHGWRASHEAFCTQEFLSQHTDLYQMQYCENAQRMRKGPTGWSFECKNLQDAEKWPYKAVFW